MQNGCKNYNRTNGKSYCFVGDTCTLSSGEEVSISKAKGPPIRGPCGASYRPSENYAISSGHQPFLVEILVEPKAAVTENSAKCLGTVITSRHILSAGT